VKPSSCSDRRTHAFALLALMLLLANMMMGCRSQSEEVGLNGSDPRAVRIAEQVVTALGGWEAYRAMRYLSFHFVVERDSQVTADWGHDWDRDTGDYRLEGKDDKGEELLVFFNVKTKQGQGFKGGRLVGGEEQQALLEGAYGRFINDTYWLLMPYKLRDPGVTLRFEGEEMVGRQTYEVIRLTFAPNFGLRPNDIYRAFVDPATRRIHRWEYMAESGAPPRPAWWNQWKDFNGVKLATERRFEGRNVRFLFTHIVVARDVPPGLFSPPKGVAMR